MGRTTVDSLCRTASDTPRRPAPLVCGVILGMLCALIVACERRGTATMEDSGSAADPKEQRVPIVLSISPREEFDDPSQDGWRSEMIASAAGGKLKQLARELVGRSGGTVGEFVGGVGVRDRVVQEQQLGGSELKPLVRYVSRAGGADHVVQSPEGMGYLGKRLLISSSIERRVEFKVTGVDFDDEHAVTRVRTEAWSATSGERQLVHAQMDVRWLIDGHELALRSVEIVELERIVQENAESLFTDCTRSALENNGCFETQLLRGAGHWQQRMPVRYDIDLWGVLGVAVGDVDGDGREDMYVCESRGVPNRLLLQQSDSTLLDRAEEWGVDWLEGCRSALFVDLDNDGDQDLVAALVSSVMIASNEGSRFEVRCGLPMPQQTTHLAAADYDEDGLIDVFACTYHKDAPLRRVGSSPVIAGDYLDFNKGGANALFRNQVNGSRWKFEDVTAISGLDLGNRRLTFAASWEDFDNDGDPDLYVANDFGRNCLYRQDVEASGERRFVEIAGRVGAEDSAFGMSISWGDYDRDGWMDAYIANMWSAAGKRIVPQSRFRPGMTEDARLNYLQYARGNTLLRNEGSVGQFVDVSEDSGVVMGRWAWSSPFIDINNDGWEDLVVANGYITGPESGDL